MRSNASPNGFEGYCIDVINLIAKEEKFEYTIEEVEDGRFGDMDDNGNWNGIVKKLIDKKADIGLGSMSIMAERELVVDFTAPIYDMVGISIMMLKPNSTSSLYKFLTVLESNVWFVVVGTGLFTSFLMWVFNRWSPNSYRNSKKKSENDVENENRDFTFIRSLLFVASSLTAQGGGEVPRNFSGLIVVSIWWIFG